jgi:hypothetical protein
MTRAGIAFTADEQARIQGLYERGDVLSAQRLILAKIEDEAPGADVADVVLPRLQVDPAALAAAMGVPPEFVGLAAFSTWVDDEDRPAPVCTGCDDQECECCRGLLGPVVTSAQLVRDLGRIDLSATRSRPSYEVWIPELDRWVQPDRVSPFLGDGPYANRRFRSRPVQEVPRVAP